MVTSIGAMILRHAIDKREAQMLLAHVLGVSRASIVAHPERLIAAAQEPLVDNLLSRRANGEPIAYLIGTREFYGREFAVSPATLIPRPETELLVEQALALLSGHLSPEIVSGVRSAENQSRGNTSILDLGTGSGAIAVSLALERGDAAVVAADVSGAALQIASENARRLNANVEFVQSNWYANLSGRKFDLIVSNPPYVAANDAHLSLGDLRFEPQTALTDKSEDGLLSIRTIVDGARAHLHSGGWLLFEHGYDQRETCRNLLLQAGFADVKSINDLAGIPRVAGGQIG